MTRRVLPRLSVPLLVLAGLPAHAQVQLPPGADPAVIQQREIEREQRLRTDEQRRDRIEQPVRPAAPVQPAGPGAADAVQFLVREIRFEPRSELLPAGELEALAAPYRGRTARLGELRELVTRINELYRARGIVTAQATLPPQDVTEGVVVIRLVEGRVGRVRIQGNDSTSAGYISDRITAQRGTLVDLPRLEQDLLRFNRSNDAQLRADLLPGEALGETDLGLVVTEPKRNDLRVFVDNAGAQQTGQARAGVSWRRRSLTGGRDDAYLSAVKSDGHEGLYLTYGVPVSRLGTRLNAGFFKDRTKIVNGILEPLDVTGSATAFTLSLRHPLRVEPAFQMEAIAGFKRRTTSNFIVGTPLTDATLTGGSAGLDLQALDTAGSWQVTGEVHAGVNRTEGIGERHYGLGRLAVRRTHQWSPEVSLVASLNTQYAPLKQLPSSEQVVIGGEGSVRGFTPGVFSGDRGYVLNLEAHRRLPLPTESGLSGTAMVFYDRGVVQPFRPPLNFQGDDRLTSLGVGFSVAYRDQANLRLVLGFPRHRPPEATRGYRGHVQFTWFLL